VLARLPFSADKVSISAALKITHIWCFSSGASRCREFFELVSNTNRPHNGRSMFPVSDADTRRLSAGIRRFYSHRVGHPSTGPVGDLAPIRVGEVWENPVTHERVKHLELPWQNPDHRDVVELTALVGSRVVGEHRHPNMVERFTVLRGELTVRLDGKTSVLEEGQTAEVQPGHWHDWWNAADVDALVRSEVFPAERFMHGAETLFGLARLGYTNDKGMPNLLQMAMFAREFSDVIQLRNPPPQVQKIIFALLALVARPLGYRATYPQLSRTINAPRDTGTDS
jgi:quercetin dioxygenase-like cupin family protein